MNSAPKLLVAYKKSRYEHLVLEDCDPQVMQLLEQGHVSVQSLVRSHEAHQQSLEAICEHLAQAGIAFDRRYRGDVTSARGYDLVITVGGDGTVLDLSRHIDHTPMLAINSDPRASIGYFCAGSAKDFAELLDHTLEQRWQPTSLMRFAVHINGVRCPYPVLNDVLISHLNPAAVSSYLITIGETDPEEQRSSGIWVATPAGSTAAIRSAGGYVLPFTSRSLQYLVREPYTFPARQYRHLKGIRPVDERFEIISRMKDGRVFLDGPHVGLNFAIGDTLRIDTSAPPLNLYGLQEAPRVS